MYMLLQRHTCLSKIMKDLKRFFQEKKKWEALSLNVESFTFISKGLCILGAFGKC